MSPGGCQYDDTCGVDALNALGFSVAPNSAGPFTVRQLNKLLQCFGVFLDASIELSFGVLLDASIMLPGRESFGWISTVLQNSLRLRV